MLNQHKRKYAAYILPLLLRLLLLYRLIVLRHNFQGILKSDFVLNENTLYSMQIAKRVFQQFLGNGLEQGSQTMGNNPPVSYKLVLRGSQSQALELVMLRFCSGK